MWKFPSIKLKCTFSSCMPLYSAYSGVVLWYPLYLFLGDSEFEKYVLGLNKIHVKLWKVNLCVNISLQIYCSSWLGRATTSDQQMKYFTWYHLKKWVTTSISVLVKVKVNVSAKPVKSFLDAVKFYWSDLSCPLLHLFWISNYNHP